MARPDLSLVVAPRNQLPHNQLFLESLAACSRIPAQLIVIDTSSADGSDELTAFLRAEAATVASAERSTDRVNGR